MADSTRLYMKLSGPTGTMAGESLVAERKGWIELDNYSWNLGRKSGAIDTPEPSIFSFSKVMDRSTTSMLSAMQKGDQLQAEIVIDDDMEGKSGLGMFELTIRLQHVVIKRYGFNVDIDVDDLGGKVTEKWDFDYRWITFEYQAHGRAGVKVIKLHRPLDASGDSPTKGESEQEFREAARKIYVDSDNNIGKLDDLWKRIRKEIETSKGNPDGIGPRHLQAKRGSGDLEAD